jgi:hypothetical protein
MSFDPMKRWKWTLLLLLPSTFSGCAGRRAAAASSFFPVPRDLVVECADGRCRAKSAPRDVSPDGSMASKPGMPGNAASLTARKSAKAVSDSLKKDVDCANLEDRLKGRDEAQAARARRVYVEKGCAAWLGGRGGTGAARRRIRVSQWTTIRGD